MPDRRITLLVVDDAAVFRQRIIRLLNEQENVHPVLQARNFDEAVSWLQHTAVDLVLLDISMPGKSGIQLLKLIKSRYTSTKVWMISNHAEEHYRQVCMAAGADRFFDKSLDVEEIGYNLAMIGNEIQKSEIAE